MASQQPSETHDVFLHREGDETVAYQGGHCIARMTRTSQERFIAELHVWIRKNNYQGPFWRVEENGHVTQDTDIPSRVAKAFENQATPEG